MVGAQVKRNSLQARLLQATAAGFLGLVFLVFSGVVSAQSAGTNVQITLGPQAQQEIQAWRRANGLDPADPSADAALRQHRNDNTKMALRMEKLRQLAAAPPPPRLSLLASANTRSP